MNLAQRISAYLFLILLAIALFFLESEPKPRPAEQSVVANRYPASTALPAR
ncbi:hypothetical protein CLV84_0995 [Neolewinella xylanilytica]|uniref:Uncharacterized protein n=1 Tax=Neolewinella xylanilytica TaxID=1514080 RepID=A0A2S6I981_9BACT|nr:hypothetical protein [Neolewinella xylanilytica]PPK88032.1 hypothetical protein CLV84_0995 [Neolewinella xylanilytica]